MNISRQLEAIDYRSSNILVLKGDHIQTIHINRLINIEFMVWVNESGSLASPIQWKVETLSFKHTKLYVLALYADGCRQDRLYEYLTRTQIWPDTLYGVAYCFTKMSCRNACVKVLSHLLDVTQMKMCMPINTSIEDGDQVYCKCGGSYQSHTVMAHFNTQRHQRWVADMVDLRSDI